MVQAPADFDALSRQYWQAWGDAIQGATAGPGEAAGMRGFRDAMEAWTATASGHQPVQVDVLEHFGRQHREWFARMQQVAAQFAGRGHRATDVAGAWRQALGGDPFQALVQGMRGNGLEGLGQWNEAMAPFLQGLRSDATATLGMPAFGFAREHQQRLQALARAQLRWQDALAAYQALMARASQEAFTRFEDRLAEREEPGRQLGSVRALFDLWVDAAEEAYAGIALSSEYRRAYGELVNAQMGLRAAAQDIAGQAADALGMPTRTELDSAHRKIAELERAVRRLQRQADDGGGLVAPVAEVAPPGAGSRPGPARKSARPVAKTIAKTASKKVSKKVARPAAKKSSTRPVKKPANHRARKR